MVDCGDHVDDALRTSDNNHRVAEQAIYQTSASDHVVEYVETINILMKTETGLAIQSLTLDNPPNLGSEAMDFPASRGKKVVKNLHADQIDQICVIVAADDAVDIRSRISTLQADDIGNETIPNALTKVKYFEAQSWESLKLTFPYYKILSDVFPEEVPCELPKDNGTKHK